jgi:DNA-binding transcriptional MerR regulator
MKTPPTSASMSSGQVAAGAGVSVDTLRHYERRGLLARPPRARNGYRAYPPEALARVMLIQRALSVGFSLDELARILRARERGMAPCVEVRALAARKLAEVERHIESLLTFRDTLRGTLDDWDSRLEKGRSGEPAKLLESLADPVGGRAREPAPWRGARFDRRRNKKERT